MQRDLCRINIRQCDNGGVCGRNDQWVRGGITSRTGCFLFAVVMGRLTDEIRPESPWTMMFTDNIVICSERREQVEESLERWRCALERRGMKVSWNKIEYMCMNERKHSRIELMREEEVANVDEFKYLGSPVQSNGER